MAYPAVALTDWNLSSPKEVEAVDLIELAELQKERFLPTDYKYLDIGDEAEEITNYPVTYIGLLKPPGIEQQLDINRADITILSRIRELGTYENGWNRPDTIAPSIKAMNDAEQFARALDLPFIHFPNIGAADDGEITFLWNLKNGFYLDLGFVGNGSYSFFAKLPNGDEIIVDKAPVKLPLPEMVLACLRKSG